MDEWEEVHAVQEQTIEEQQLTIDLLQKRLTKTEREQRAIEAWLEERERNLAPLKEKYSEPDK